MTNKELEIEGCRIFACSDIDLIDDMCKDLYLKKSATIKAKEIAMRYLKKTYHKPIYTDVKFIFPACIYIASYLEKDRRTQAEIRYMTKCSTALIKKWYRIITKELGISVIDDSRKRYDMVECIG